MTCPTVAISEDPVAWDAYVASHPQATPYHQHRWLALLTKVFSHRPIPLVATRDGRCAGVFPLVLMNSWMFGRFLVSLPFVNYGGLLADSEEVERALWVWATALSEEAKASFLEARHLRSHPFIAHRKRHKVTMILDLAPSIDGQWNAFDAKLRNQIRKAERSGLTVRIGKAAEIPGFYQVFARNMRDLGTPVYPQRFFEEILISFPETSWIFSVCREQKIIASGIALAYRDTLEVPWAASLREYRSACPNNLLYWGLIQYAIKEGFRRFDFGRSTPGEGTFRFKEQWGARPVPLVWEYWTRAGTLPDMSPKNPKYAWVISLWKRLPVAITNRLGPAIVRNIP
jgi:FemAB-related protein (PEP-CTERM system-associated)